MEGQEVVTAGRAEASPDLADEVGAPGAPGAPGAAETDEAQRSRRERILALKRELVGGDLFTAAEVAEILDIHSRTVGEYIRDGKLRAFQFGGGWKISESALRAFVRDQTQGRPIGAEDQGAAVTVLSRALNGLLSLVPVGAGPGAPGAADAGAAKGGADAARRFQYKCSFCGKAHTQVRRLIAGPGGIYICDACVQLCNEIIAKETSATQTAAE